MVFQKLIPWFFLVANKSFKDFKSGDTVIKKIIVLNIWHQMGLKKKNALKKGKKTLQGKIIKEIILRKHIDPVNIKFIFAWEIKKSMLLTNVNL